MNLQNAGSFTQILLNNITGKRAFHPAKRGLNFFLTPHNEAFLVQRHTVWSYCIVTPFKNRTISVSYSRVSCSIVHAACSFASQFTSRRYKTPHHGVVLPNSNTLHWKSSLFLLRRKYTEWKIRLIGVGKAPRFRPIVLKAGVFSF